MDRRQALHDLLILAIISDAVVQAHSSLSRGRAQSRARP